MQRMLSASVLQSKKDMSPKSQVRKLFPKANGEPQPALHWRLLDSDTVLATPTQKLSSYTFGLRAIVVGMLCFAAGCVPPDEAPLCSSPFNDALFSESETIPGCSSNPPDLPLWESHSTGCRAANGLRYEFADEVGHLGAGKHKMAYYFQPAHQFPEHKPLIVLYNGGPYTASALLLAGGTGRSRLASDGRLLSSPENNPNSWQSVGNLLYLDPNGCGFSDGENSSPFKEDAESFAATILRFLQTHPRLLDNRIVLSGESYGGLRTLLIHQVLLELRGSLKAIWTEGWPGQDIAAWTRSRFSHSIHIQPGWNLDFLKGGYDPGPFIGGYQGVMNGLPGHFEAMTGVTKPDFFPRDFVLFCGKYLLEDDWYEQNPMTPPGEMEFFVTNAGLDPSITSTPAIAAIEGVETTNECDQTFVIGSNGRRLRLADYPEAGHSVPAFAGEKILQDIKLWMEETDAFLPLEEP